MHRLNLSFRRLFRLQKRQITGMGHQAEDHFERNFVGRLSRLGAVRRFIFFWLALVLLLSGCTVVQTRALAGYYRRAQPASGGIYTEGIVGTFTNASPLYATGQVNNAVSRLVFAGLLRYDETNNLVGALAETWKVDALAKVYTVYLRPNLVWHDGKPLTSADVAFTFRAIQNPDAQSPLSGSWKNVSIQTPSPTTVVFTLPNSLSSFPDSLTTGIIPKHILGDVSMDQMRSVAFNTTRAVGSGPFMMQGVEIKGDSPTSRQTEIQLKPFSNYYRGKPKLARFVVRAFGDQHRMVESFKRKEINAMVGLARLPEELNDDTSVMQYTMPLTAATMIFFKNSSGVLKSMPVRQALVLAANTQELINSLGYQVIPVRGPLLQGQLGYDPAYAQAKFNLAKARDLLKRDGWKVNPEGILVKGKQTLSFGLSAQADSEYAKLANMIADQWRQIGADVRVYAQQASDLQGTAARHDYDALLYSISIGRDPDVFVYWDSSLADIRSESRLNFSEYKSAASDIALETGRTRTDPKLRAAKYKAFLQAWHKDVPALGLYQPRFLYITRGQVFGLYEHQINLDVGRYADVERWMIRQSLQNIVK